MKEKENISDQKKLTELYTEVQVLQQQLGSIESQIKDVDNQEQDLKAAVTHLNSLKEIKDNQEALIPIVNGVFVKAKIIKSDSLFVNIGANTVVKKTIDETVKMLEQNIKEIDTYRENLLIKYQNLITVLEDRQKKLTQEVNKQRMN